MCGICIYIQYVDGFYRITEENSGIFSTTACIVVSSGMWAVKLCSSRIPQFLTGFRLTPVDMYTTTTTTTIVLRPFVRDYPGEPVLEETLTHPRSWLSSNIFIGFFHLLQSIASSVCKLHAWQSVCTTFLHNLFGLPLWSRALHLIFHTFLHPVSVFFS